jgi:uncharacterized protein (DUF983 family)
MLLEAERKRAEMEATLELRCPHCGRVNGKYDPPLRRFTAPCRRCGGWIDTTDMRETP